MNARINTFCIGLVISSSKMGNENSSPPAPRRELVSRGPDQFRVLRLQAERQEVQIGGQRLETERVRMVHVSGSGSSLHVAQREHVEVRLQSSSGSRGVDWRSPRPALTLGDSSDDDSDSDGKCTYDDDGPGYMLQPWYKCRTCWGNDADESSFGCCSHCANTCHRGHRLVQSGLANGECDCGQNKHQAAVCTWHITRREYVKQPFYRCYDCFGGLNEGVCYQCWKICHRTHNTRYAGIMSAFCDCGLDTCRIRCSIASPK